MTFYQVERPAAPCVHLCHAGRLPCPYADSAGDVATGDVALAVLGCLVRLTAGERLEWDENEELEPTPTVQRQPGLFDEDDAGERAREGSRRTGGVRWGTGW